MTSAVQHRVRTQDGITLAADCYDHDDARPSCCSCTAAARTGTRGALQRVVSTHAGYTVVAYDTRGHGDSDWDPAGGYDLERLATDLLAVREHFSADIAPAVVRCISWGHDRARHASVDIRGVVGGGRPGRRHPAA